MHPLRMQDRANTRANHAFGTGQSLLCRLHLVAPDATSVPQLSCNHEKTGPLAGLRQPQLGDSGINRNPTTTVFSRWDSTTTRMWRGHSLI